MINLQDKRLKVIIYGGNGFVGTHVAKRLSSEDMCVVCLSRSGYKPLHLKDEHWSESIRWCKGDANSPDSALLSTADVIIILVGSAPIPTFSRHAYENQLKSNGYAPKSVIDCAADVGVKQLILMSANIPFFLKTKHFAYFRGKDIAFESAKQFAALSPEHSAVVLQPGALYGKRHLNNGKVLPLDTFLSPFSKVFPSQFTSVNKISNRVAKIILNKDKYSGKFSVLTHPDI